MPPPRTPGSSAWTPLRVRGDAAAPRGLAAGHHPAGRGRVDRVADTVIIQVPRGTDLARVLRRCKALARLLQEEVSDAARR